MDPSTWTREYGAEVAVGIGKTVTVNTATQTEDPVSGEDRTSITTMDGQEGRRQKARKETSIDIRENNPAVVETMAIMGGGDKRKEISPPEQTKAKRSQLNARGTGNAIQSARWVNEPLRGRTQCLDEPMPTDLRNPRRRPRRRLAPDERWDYVTNVYERERTPRRALYSEVVNDIKEGPYGNTYRTNMEIAYLRKARIPHWEWRGYSSREPSEDENEEIPSRETLEPGRLPYLAARVNRKRSIVTDKRQEAPKVDPLKGGKRPRRRVKPEAVLVRMEQGGNVPRHIQIDSRRTKNSPQGGERRSQDAYRSLTD